MEAPPDDHHLQPVQARWLQPPGVTAAEASSTAAARCAKPSPDSILARLERMEDRRNTFQGKSSIARGFVAHIHTSNSLKRLEGKQQRTPQAQANNNFVCTMPPIKFTMPAIKFPRRPQSKPVPVATSSEPSRQQQLKEVLMERLQLLENRLLQISRELDKSSRSSSSSASGFSTWTEENRRKLHSEQLKEKDLIVPVSSSSKIPAGPQPSLNSEYSKHQDRMQKTLKRMQDKDFKDKMDILEKMHKDEVKRMERTRMYTKWFQTGCL